MRDALAGTSWDLILSDFRLPAFNALEAFAVYREFRLDGPFLIVSGAIGEETAASAMKAGVHDYVSKNNLARLAPAVRREMGDARIRRERIQAEAALLRAHAELAAIQANVPALLMVANEDLSVRAANSLAGAEDTIACVNHLADPAGCAHAACPPCRIRSMLVDTLATGACHRNVETWLPLSGGATGKTSCFLITSAPLRSDSPKKALICALDVTDLKRAQEELVESHERLRAANVSLDLRLEELQKALKEKDVLFREVQHRVKNNLAVISSLLSLQAEQSESAAAQAALAESRDRIRSMALIHEQLCWTGHMAEIEFGQYIDRLTGSLLDSYVDGPGRVGVHTAVDVTLTLDQATPCGLIVQELFSNSLKHAFPKGARGEIRIELHKHNGTCRLHYRDNGIGLPVGFQVNGAQTLGLQLVSDLTAQLRGTMNYSNANGARFELTFPAAAR
jgi:two-component sensor histidine kinase